MKRIIKIGALSLLFLGVIILLVAANYRQKRQVMATPILHLEKRDGIALINKQELMSKIYASGLYFKGMKKSEFDEKKIEDFIDSLNVIDKAEVYLGLDSIWHIDAITRRPIARVIANGVTQFYIDQDFKVMHLSPYARPDIICFTGMDTLIKNKNVFNRLINNDSLKTKLKLDQIYRISKYVCKDTFYNALVEQFYYSEKEGFVMIPRVGSQTIIFGEATSDEMVKKKFKKLSVFYHDVIPYVGWDKYKSVNLEYNNQIVATKK